MIKVIALTQYGFLALGMMLLVVKSKATGKSTQEILAMPDWYLLVIPLVWIAFAALCSRFQKAPLSWSVACVTGVILALLSFLFMATVTF
ncbi:MAG TPA: hypothetical protein VMH87_01285 [Pseudomonadales bacterium]|nr:hypothetical protein [Pseudomonadales bacterium]